MNSEYLRYFTETAKECHILRAANNLNIARSTLSRAISNMEDELGIKFFECKGRCLNLTPQGKIFAERAEKAPRFLTRRLRQIKSS